MKNFVLLLILFGTTVMFTNCNSDDDEDLTVGITGVYLGQYSDNAIGTINPYEVTVTKIDFNTISIRPTSRNEFEEFEIDIERINSSSLSSPTDNNQQLEELVLFILSSPVTITLMLDSTGEAMVFGGELQ